MLICFRNFYVFYVVQKVLSGDYEMERLGEEAISP